MEAIRLTDGSWNPPAHLLDDELSEGGMQSPPLHDGGTE